MSDNQPIIAPPPPPPFSPPRAGKTKGKGEEGEMDGCMVSSLEEEGRDGDSSFLPFPSLSL